MTTKVNHLDESLEKKGLRLVRKFNICGYFEYHVVNLANQTIAKDTVAHHAINRARFTFQA